MAIAVVLALLASGQFRKERVIRQTAAGSLSMMLLALPVILNILHNPDFGRPLDFDYVHYLEEFWPLSLYFSAIYRCRIR